MGPSPNTPSTLHRELMTPFPDASVWACTDDNTVEGSPDETTVVDKNTRVDDKDRLIEKYMRG